MKNRFEWRHQYDDERDQQERTKSDYVETMEPLTEQHHTKDADINTIVRRFGITDGAIPPAVLDPKYYGDFSDVVDFKTSLERVRQAEENFRSLPADIRNRFNNDPTRLYQWVTDEANADAAVELGLLSKHTPPAEPPTPPAEPPKP